MNEVLQRKCELFDQTRTAISKKFKFEKPIMSIAAGLIYTGADREVDIEKLTECRDILKRHAGHFSEYRDIVKLALISEMALSDEPEQYIDDVKSVYEKLHKGKFRDNSYMVLAAMLLCDIGRQNTADEIIEKHNEIMCRMNDLHPVLTSSEDISYAILLALSDKSVDAMLSDMAECYDYLKKECKIKVGSDSVQGLSEILALTDGNMKAKCDRIVSLYNQLKGHKVDAGGYAFISLGTFVNVDADPEVLVKEILEADAYLSGLKGFDEKNLQKNYILMFAIILVSECYGTGMSIANSISVSTVLSVIKVQKLVTMITVLSNVLPSVLGAVMDKSDAEETATEAGGEED